MINETTTQNIRSRILDTATLGVSSYDLQGFESLETQVTLGLIPFPLLKMSNLN